MILSKSTKLGNFHFVKTHFFKTRKFLKKHPLVLIGFKLFIFYKNGKTGVDTENILKPKLDIKSVN